MQAEHNIAGTTPVPAMLGYDDSERLIADRRIVSNAFVSPADSFAYRYVKRGIDIALVSLFAPLWVPLCMMLALCVMITSPGPIFFSHRRIGRGGAFFSMWKFRTMCNNSAEVLEHYLANHPELREEWKLNHKLRNDPRVTPLGRFMRKSSLDELPQLWNVLTGRMSLVGPRPIVAAEAEKYGKDFAYYLAVKPGVAGLWQASGRSELSYGERVHLDSRYVKEWSLMGDFKLLLHTTTKVANSEGAY